MLCVPLRLECAIRLGNLTQGGRQRPLLCVIISMPSLQTPYFLHFLPFIKSVSAHFASPLLAWEFWEVGANG